jgi:branched-chain amino acid aminotransferase
VENLPQSELNTMLFNSDHSVYEVIRVIDGIALFLEDHFARLKSSVQIRGFQFEMEFSDFRQNITELAKLNHQMNGNVKFVIAEHEPVNKWSFSFIPHSYPEPKDYRQGVKVGLLFAERVDPNAKFIQNTVRELANQMIADEKLYEVLLVNRNGQITEGSRSNVFFVKGNRFYTAPASSVLEGVTRQKVLECLRELAFLIIEKEILASEIIHFEAVFLTGTSPKVLPVNCIGAVQFSAKNHLIGQLMAKYNSMIEKYINERKK